MFDQNFLLEIKQILLAQKEEISSKVKETLEVDADGDEMDKIQGNMLLGITKQFTVRNNERLIQIEDALRKIKDLTYGACEDCEEDIPKKRLLINPYFTTCVTCAEKREYELRQRGKR